MQKFTIFSLILSVSIVLFMGDILFFDYLKIDTFQKSVSGEVVVDETLELLPTEDAILDEVLPEESLPVEIEVEADDAMPEVNEPVDLSSIEILNPELSIEHFRIAGFSDPTLKETKFTGSIYQLIDFSDQTEAYVYHSNIFDGEKFIGTVYEIKYPTEIAAFQGYLAIRERAMGIPDSGEINETNGYGDSSFYFNHKIKTKTVHIIIKKSDTIYALDYEYVNHETMKKLLDLLPS